MELPMEEGPRPQNAQIEQVSEQPSSDQNVQRVRTVRKRKERLYTACTNEAEPQDGWKVEDWTAYVRHQNAAVDELHEHATVRLYRLGCGLRKLKTDLKLGRGWSKWQEDNGINRGRGLVAMKLSRYAPDEESLRGLTIEAAKKKFLPPPKPKPSLMTPPPPETPVAESAPSTSAAPTSAVPPPVTEEPPDAVAVARLADVDLLMDAMEQDNVRVNRERIEHIENKLRAQLKRAFQLRVKATNAAA
jgi:hypothetical protein